MGQVPYVIRQEMDSGGEFDKSQIPPNSPSREGVIFTYRDLSDGNGGLFSFEALERGAHFIQAVRVMLQYEDADSFEVGLTHNPGGDIGEAQKYKTTLVSYSSGSITHTSSLVDVDNHSGDRIIVDMLGYVLASDEMVWVDTAGVTESTWAEVVGLPIQVGAGATGVPLTRR